MIKRILFLFIISLFLVSCEAVEPTPTIETPVESTEPTQEPLPEPKEIDMINYTYYHQFLTIGEQVTDISLALYRLQSTNPELSPLEAQAYIKNFVNDIEIDHDFLGNHNTLGSQTYYLIGKLDDFDVYMYYLKSVVSFATTGLYRTQTHLFGYKDSGISPQDLIFVRNDEMYHLNEMVDDIGYDIHVLAQIFGLFKIPLGEYDTVKIELPENTAINYQHVFFLDGEKYTLGQARGSGKFDEADILDKLSNVHIMTEDYLWFDPIEYPYYGNIYYDAFIFLAHIPRRTTQYRHYVFELEAYAYYYKTTSLFTTYYVLYNEVIYTIEDVLTQDLLTFEELNRLIELQREALIAD